MCVCAKCFLRLLLGSYVGPRCKFIACACVLYYVLQIHRLKLLYPVPVLNLEGHHIGVGS